MTRPRESLSELRARPCLTPLEDRTVPSLDFGWAFGVDVNGSPPGIATDSAGDVYLTGEFTGTVDFDPGPGTLNLVHAGGSQDAFVAKYSASGSLVWAINLGAGTAGAAGIAVDGAGNVYATGQGDAQREGFGDGAFLVKLDAATGALHWTREVGNTYGTGVAVDGGGNVTVVGEYYGSSQFGSTILTNPTGYNGFVTKLDSDGNFLWAKQALQVVNPGTNIGPDPEKVAVDGAGNAYITGRYYGTADFDPGPGAANLTSKGGSDVFVWKLDASGGFVWARSMGSTESDGGNGNGGIALDSAGNVVVAGAWSGSSRNDFDPGSGTLKLAASHHAFVVKLSSSGDLMWGRSLPASGSTLAVDSAGDVYSTGIFSGSADFDPGKGRHILTSAGANDIFVSKLTSTGNFAAAAAMGGSGNDAGRAIAVDGSNNVYTSGFFSGTADFDPGPGTFNLTGGGSFVSKLTQAGTLQAFGGSALMPAAPTDSTASKTLAPMGLDGSFALFGRFIFDPTLDTLRDIDPLNN